MPTIFTVRTVKTLRHQLGAWRDHGARIALVPTMGALHDGHLSLVRLARNHADKVVTSLFVNPAQFSPTEDLSRYPRDEAGDGDLLAAAGCDLLYAPAGDEIYPNGFATVVNVNEQLGSMEDAIRPEHFAGVATVVAKLLIQAMPDVAVFGEKDYQQLQVIRRMVADLDLAVDILAGAIVRNRDGLALSSRNAYLSPEERQVAPALFKALQGAVVALNAGGAVEAVERQAHSAILAAGFDAVDYIETRRPAGLTRLGPGVIAEPARLLAAARLGKTRLLDNLAV